MSLVVDVYFECASESVKTEKEFLQGGQRDLKKERSFLKKNIFFFAKKKKRKWKRTYEYFLLSAPSLFHVLDFDSREYSLVPVFTVSTVLGVIFSLNVSIHFSSSTVVDLAARDWGLQKIPDMLLPRVA